MVKAILILSMLLLTACVGDAPERTPDAAYVAPDASPDATPAPALTTKGEYIQTAVEAFCAVVEQCEPGMGATCVTTNMLRLCNIVDCDAIPDQEKADALLVECLEAIETDIACLQYPPLPACDALISL